MSPINFIIPGDPMGFINNRHPWTKKGKAYCAYRDKVCLFAKGAGLMPPLMPCRERVYYISTTAVFKKGKGKVPDPENVRKCVVDALCYHGIMPGKKKGSHDDFWTGGEFAPPLFGNDPYVAVSVKEIPHCSEAQECAPL